MRIGHRVTHVVSYVCGGAIKDCMPLSRWPATFTLWSGVGTPIGCPQVRSSKTISGASSSGCGLATTTTRTERAGALPSAQPSQGQRKEGPRKKGQCEEGRGRGADILSQAAEEPSNQSSGSVHDSVNSLVCDVHVIETRARPASKRNETKRNETKRNETERKLGLGLKLIPSPTC